ncbi:hypothetical protein FZEAL_2490 [Fusarium zealandicum]|uniref:Uncharacterized protein n=1 Tax=Fusarium zealandicum TaxID=1053134 RepID=A0A8H4UQN8_9HYPO|nr:hypothetical protein FZEAL_2490 [Fusarium zealandicum]
MQQKQHKTKNSTQAPPSESYDMLHNVHLPLELILNIVHCSLPPGGPNQIVDISTPEAQLLVAWTQVSRATYKYATQLLREHCVYINTTSRLQRFLQCLSDSKDSEAASTLPSTTRLTSVSSVYFGLDKDEMLYPELHLFKDLCSELGHSLRRLIIDIPFRKRLPQTWLDTDCNAMFVKGLEQLPSVEEFVTTGGLPAIDFWRHTSPVCALWPNLSRVASFETSLTEEELWSNIATRRTLGTVVLALPSLAQQHKWNVKRAIGQHWNRDSGRDPSCARPLRITLANHEYSTPMIDTEDEEVHDPMGLISVSYLGVPVPDTMNARFDHACREWLIDSAIKDTLWEFGA